MWIKTKKVKIAFIIIKKQVNNKNKTIEFFHTEILVVDNYFTSNLSNKGSEKERFIIIKKQMHKNNAIVFLYTEILDVDK